MSCNNDLSSNSDLLASSSTDQEFLSNLFTTAAAPNIRPLHFQSSLPLTPTGMRQSPSQQRQHIKDMIDSVLELVEDDDFLDIPPTTKTLPSLPGRPRNQ